MGNIYRGYINIDKVEFITNDEEINEEDKINYGDLFFNTRNTLELVGKVAIWRNELPLAYYNSNLMKLSFENNFFMNYWFNTRIGIKKLRQLATGTTSVAAIYTKDLLKIKFNIPSTLEQQKIANFLTKLDEKIQTQREIITHLETLIKGYRQKLFSQELRFKDENGRDFPDWEEKKLKNYLIQKSIRNKNLNVVNILSVSNSKGFILQSEQFDNHRVASKDISNYKIVKENDFAYNPSRINVGSIAKLTGFKQGVVSPMYIVFSLNKTISSLFFENLINTHLFKHLVKVGCSGSVRDSLNYEELENFKFKMPSLKEQEKIANFLSKLDKKLTTEKELLIELEEQKKFFLQNMFV